MVTCFFYYIFIKVRKRKIQEM